MKKLTSSILCLLPIAAMAQQTEKRSVLFILTDDMQRTSIASWGNENTTTPNIDRITERGAAFQNCYTNGAIQGALSMPSRAMIMTGCTLYELTQDGRTIPQSTTTLPEELRAEGYRTFATGKWHSDYESFTRSFSEGANLFFGGMHTYQSGGHVSPRLVNFDPTGNYKDQTPFVANEFSSKVYADAAVRFIESTKSDDRPFFAYVAFTSPHDPRIAHPHYAKRPADEQIKLPANFRAAHPFDNGDMNVRDEIYVPAPRTEATVRHELADYYGMVDEVDVQIGRLLQAIEGRDDIIVVFAADNGLAMGQHGLMGKQNLYQHSIGVPLVICAKEFKAGDKRTDLCYLSDIAPTLRSMLGLSKSPTASGISLTDDKAKRKELWLAYSNIQRAIVELPYKLIVYNVGGEARTQLFDIQNDPLEWNDLSAKPEMKKQVKSMHAKLIKQLRDNGEPAHLQLGTHTTKQKEPARQ